MKTRTKWFLGALLAAAVIAAVVAGEPKILVYLAVLYGAAWLLWRGFVFLAILLRPARRYVEPARQHVDDSLRRAGLGKIADVSNTLQAGVDRAVDATEKDIAARK